MVTGESFLKEAYQSIDLSLFALETALLLRERYALQQVDRIGRIVEIVE